VAFAAGLLGPGFALTSVPFAWSSMAALMAADMVPCRLVATPKPLAVEPTGSCAASWGTIAVVGAAAGLGLSPDA
jgi:hypothetical protein